MDGEDVRFLELNGRIQVEHPVTEAVTGLDLVELQLRIAGGEALDPTARPSSGTRSRRGSTPRIRGPSSRSPGGSSELRLPEGIRVDTGVAEGDEVGAAYDPLIAKLIAHGADREQALERLADALAATHVVGVRTNLPLLRWLVGHPVVRAGAATTAFLDEHPPLSAPPRPLPGRAFAGGWRLNLARARARACAVGRRRRARARTSKAATACSGRRCRGPWSPCTSRWATTSRPGGRSSWSRR